MKRYWVFCWIFIFITVMCTSPTTIAESTTLKDGISCFDALTVMAAAAQTQGEELDDSSASVDGATLSINVTHFHLTAHSGNNGLADSVTVSTGYLDADLAKSMGIIYGMICVHLGGMSDEGAQTMLSNIDFNAFNTLESNTQTLIFNGYKVIVSIMPEDEYCYQLTLALQTQPKESLKNNRIEEASNILQLLNVKTSAVFLYDENTDPNKILGQPNSYYSKVTFALASVDPNATQNANLSVDQGGSIEVFETRTDAINRQYKILSTRDTYLGTAEYTIIQGNVLLRLSSSIPLDELGTIIPRFISVVDRKEAGVSIPSHEQAASVKVGDIIKFGSYEQDGNKSNGSEPIEWIVIHVEKNTAMLLSVNALDVYNTYWGAVTWDSCTLRSWMNETFYDSAFSSSEKAAVLSETVVAEKNPNYDTNPGKDTKDKVFALSYNEAKNLLSNSQRRCKPTVYAAKNQSVYTDGTGNCYWWLRSPGKPGSGAAIVCTDGSFDYDVSYDGFCYGMRPAIRIDLTGVSF